MPDDVEKVPDTRERMPDTRGGMPDSVSESASLNVKKAQSMRVGCAFKMVRYDFSTALHHQR